VSENAFTMDEPAINLEHEASQKLGQPVVPKKKVIKTTAKPQKTKIVEKAIVESVEPKYDKLLSQIEELTNYVKVLSEEVKNINKRIGQTQGITTDEYFGANNTITIGGKTPYVNEVEGDALAILQERNRKIEDTNLRKTITL